MSTNFPSSLDSLTNPISTDSVAVVDHAAQHANANDAIEALETKVGVDSSAVTTTLDYKLKNTSSVDPGHKHTEASLNTSDVTTGDVTSTKHGYAPKSPADATKFLNGAATPEFALVKDSDLSTSDVTTNNFTTSKHGFVPKGTNVGAFLKDDGTWAVPGGSASAVTILPVPNYPYDDIGANTAFTGDTTAFIGQVNIPFAITVNKISIDIQTHTTNGTLKLALFSEDGQTKAFEVTTATITGTGLVTTAVSAVSIVPGNYYLMIVPVSTTSTRPVVYSTSSVAGSILSTLMNGVTSEPRILGTLTVTASTVPSTFSPTAIVSTDDCGAVFRLDT